MSHPMSCARDTRSTRRARRSPWTAALGIAVAAALLITPAIAPAFKVITHMALAARMADRSVNLDHFLRDLDLLEVDLPRDAQDAAARAFPEITIPGAGARNLIEAGAVLEDVTPRFCNHFYDPVNDRGLFPPDAAQGAVRAFCGGPVPRPISRDWGFDGGGETNARTWLAAMELFEQGITARSLADRRAALALMFQTLGHVLHLLQDTAQPSHTRNDVHGIPVIAGQSRLEEFGATHLSPTGFDITVDLSLDDASVRFPTFAAYFDGLAELTNGRFFSDDTIFSVYAEPSDSTTGRRLETVGGQGIEVVVSSTLRSRIDNRPLRLARVTRSLLFGEDFSLDAPSDVVLSDNAQGVLVPGVARGAGLLDHFFRGRIEAVLDPDTGQLQLTNISDPAGVASPAVELAFASGTVRLFYETALGTVEPLGGGIDTATIDALPLRAATVLPGDIRARVDALSDPGLPPNTRVGDERRLLVLYRGMIGAEMALAATRIEMGSNVSLLISFDRSGSIARADLEQAKDAALTLLSLLQNGEANRVSVHSFSSVAGIDSGFSADLDTARARITALQPGGNTALLDAILLAGTAASDEASAATAARSNVVILFTDGLENSSGTDVQTAARAISRIDQPLIDEVFLVFVGNSPQGRAALSDVAALAGRRFLAIDDFGDLRSELLNLLQSSM